MRGLGGIYGGAFTGGGCALHRKQGTVTQGIFNIHGGPVNAAGGGDIAIKRLPIGVLAIEIQQPVGVAAGADINGVGGGGIVEPAVEGAEDIAAIGGDDHIPGHVIALRPGGWR